jgi:hypothetical protein
MKKILLILFPLSAILILAVTGCRIDLKSFSIKDTYKEKQEIIETLNASDESNRELFKKYFSYIKLGDVNILPTGETFLECEFNNKEEFEFVYTVFDVENGEFVERCTNYTSSEGSDGMVMEALEWTLLRPGNYEYRIYVEDTLVETIPFEVISYTDYFKQKL